MGLVHVHQWKERGRIFTGRIGSTSVERVTSDADERFVWGVTTILMRCETCGDQKTMEVKGNALSLPWAENE